MRLSLVVDDSKVVRTVTRRIMEGLGFEVVEAENGKVALEKTEQHDFEVIMLDWNMPVMNGLDFLKLFRQLKESQQTKVVFCTTENDISKITEAMQSGADEYIMKPYDEVVIKDKLLQLGIIRD